MRCVFKGSCSADNILSGAIIRSAAPGFRPPQPLIYVGSRILFQLEWSRAPESRYCPLHFITNDDGWPRHENPLNLNNTSYTHSSYQHQERFITNERSDEAKIKIIRSKLDIYYINNILLKPLPAQWWPIFYAEHYQYLLWGSCV